MSQFKTLTALVGVMLCVTQAFAHNNKNDRNRRYNKARKSSDRHHGFSEKKSKDHNDNHRRNYESFWRNKPFKGHRQCPAPTPSVPTPQPKCGDVITQNVTLTKDLICPTTSGFALYIVGNNITLDGGKHKISAMDGGVYVSGDGVTVKNTRINNITGGFGIMTWESNQLVIKGNDLSGNLIGVSINADERVIDQVEVSGNTIKKTLSSAVRTGMDFDKAGGILNPRIFNNNLSESLGFALSITARHWETSDADKNNFKDSQNGITLGRGDYYLHDLSFRDDDIEEQKIFASGTDNLVVKRVDVSGGARSIFSCRHNDDDDEISLTSVGIDLWGVLHFDIQGLTSRDNAVGVYVESREGYTSDGSILYSTFVNNLTAGIILAQFDIAPPFGIGDIDLAGNLFSVPEDAFDILSF